MLRLTLAFLSGSLLVAIAAYAASGSPLLIGFGIGFLLAVLLAAAAVSSPIRQRRVARFLKSLAYALERAGGRRAKIAVRRHVSARRVPQIEQELYSALRGFGATSTDAWTAVRYAISEQPAANFDTLFRLASAAAARQKGVN